MTDPGTVEMTAVAEQDRLSQTRADSLFAHRSKPSSLTRDALRRLRRNPGAIAGEHDGRRAVFLDQRRTFDFRAGSQRLARINRAILEAIRARKAHLADRAWLGRATAARQRRHLQFLPDTACREAEAIAIRRSRASPG